MSARYNTSTGCDPESSKVTNRTDPERHFSTDIYFLGVCRCPCGAKAVQNDHNLTSGRVKIVIVRKDSGTFIDVDDESLHHGYKSSPISKIAIFSAFSSFDSRCVNNRTHI